MKTNDETQVETLAVRIKRFRMACDMSQAKLAESVGISKTAVANWESGEFPRGRNLAKLAVALGIDVAELMGETPRGVDDIAEELRLLVAFRELTKEHQLIAIKLLEALKMTGN